MCICQKRGRDSEMLQNLTTKEFHKLVKPYITNKGALSESYIMLIDQNKLVSDEKEVAEIFNDYFANIVKITTGKDPKKTETMISHPKFQISV